jgi:hypothetical protein
MIADPLAVWPDGQPYALLASAQVTPDSPMKQVQEASFVLMEQSALTPVARAALNQLRQIEQRLLVDAFFYLQLDQYLEDPDDERP